jgi:hypothetical protein
MPIIECEKPAPTSGERRRSLINVVIALAEFLRQEGNAAAIAIFFQATRKLMERIKTHAQVPRPGPARQQHTTLRYVQAVISLRAALTAGMVSGWKPHVDSA